MTLVAGVCVLIPALAATGSAAEKAEEPFPPYSLQLHYPTSAQEKTCPRDIII